MSTLSATNIRNSGSSTNNLVLNADGSVTFGNGGTLTLGAAQASNSGIAIDFTGIPSWARRITVMFNGVSTNGSSQQQLQIGSGSVVTSGYNCSSSYIAGNGTANVSTSTSGILISPAYGGASSLNYGNLYITNISGNIWIFSGVTGHIGGSFNGNYFFSGSLSLSGTLDRVRITTVNGTDTFDAGSINIMYEG